MVERTRWSWEWEGVLGGKVVGEGFVISGPSGLFSFYIIILMCFYRSPDSLKGIPYHQH